MHRLVRVIACVGVVAAFSVAGATAAQESERLTRVVETGEAGELDVSNVSGTIVIRSEDGTEIRIEAVKRAHGRLSPAEAARQLAAVRIEIQERPGRVEIRTVYDLRNARVPVDYDIVVPPGTRVTARSVSGDIEVTGVGGALRAESVSGRVRLENVARLSAGRSVSGALELTDVSSDSELAVSTVSGALRLRGVRARSLDAESVSGRMELLDVDAERVAARSVSGRIEFEGTLVPRGRYQFRSHSGAVRIGLGQQTGFELDANTFSGTIRTDMPLEMVGAGRSGPGRAVRGIHGDGSALLDVTTFSGSIAIGDRR